MSSNQRFVLMLAAMALVGIAMMRVAPAQQAAPSSAANVQEAVYARKFVLVDEQGKPCAAIQRVDGAEEGPHRTEFVIFDESGKELAALDDNAGFGGQLLLHGKDGKPLPNENSELAVYGSSGLAVFGDNTKASARLSMDETGKPLLSLTDKDGKKARTLKP